MDVEDFGQDLERALADPDTCIWEEDYQPFGNALEELAELEALASEDADAADDDEGDANPSDLMTFEQTTVINPYRHVGRNDPCPCGSGKKFKKCCLERVQAGEDIEPSP